MIACTSPAGTCSDTPFRIGLSATAAWRLVISSIISKFQDHLSERGAATRRVNFCEETLPKGFKLRLRAYGCEVVPLPVTATRRVANEALKHVGKFSLGHPTPPSSEIPSSFCASTANSIGSCL